MKIKNKSLLGICCFLLVTFAACEAKDSSSAPSPYPVYDSGAWADPLFDAEIYWIDNNRLIFKGVKDNNKRNIAIGPYNLSVWEIGKGVKAYTPYVKGVHACLRDGVFNYKVTDEPNKWHEQDKLHIYYGKFGEEKLVKPKKMSYLDLINCRVEDNPEIAAKRQAGRAIRPLLDRHGYLDIGPVSEQGKTQDIPVTLYRPGHPEGLTLSVRMDQVNYYAFKDAYFFRGFFRSDTSAEVKALWPSNSSSILGWLHPDGRIEPVVLPAEPWPDKKVPAFASANKLSPLRNGYMVLFGEAKGPYDAGTLGAYLLRDKKLTKVVGGYIKSRVVSPDGCKVAFVHYPYFESTLTDDPSPIRLKAVDLCSTQEEKNHGQ